MQPTRPAFGFAIPVLASLDMARTLEFFSTTLGFNTQHLPDHSYGMAVRGEVEIHFWLCDDKHIAENTSCYVRVADIHALYAELKPRMPDLAPVAEREWGMAELYVLDPDGNLIKFGQPLPE